MNKILFRLTGVIAVAIFSMSAYAETFEVDGIYYKTDWYDNTIAIVTHNEDIYINDDLYYKGNISIPATVTHNGTLLRVTTIGFQAFSLCDELESVTLPEGLLVIEDMAFSNSGISEITLPATLTSLGSSSFQSCNNLKSIHVAESNPKFCEIDGVLFDKAKETLVCYPSGKGTSYVVPVGTKTIGKEAFAESQITSITLNEGLICIDDAAFSLTDLKSITIPGSVTQFGKFIFEFSNPEYIVSNILEPQSISVSSFEYAEYDSQNEIYNKTILYVPLGTESKYKAATGWNNFASIRECDRIEMDGFEYEVTHDTHYATLLKKSTSVSYKEEIEIPGTISYNNQQIPVVGIAEDAFKGMSLGSILLSGNIQTIGANAFNGCSNLKSVTVKNETPIDIDENVFEGVYAKATLIVPKKTKSAYSATLPWSKFSSIKEVDSEIVVDNLLYEIDFNSNTATLVKKNTFVYSSDEIEIPETITYNDLTITVTGIAENAFKSTNLKSVTFSKNINVIGNNAFSGCSNLKKIIVRNEMPIAINENVFEGVYDKATLFVPQGFLPQYQQAEVWKKFTNIQEEQTGDIETEGGFRVGGIYYEIDTETPTNVRVVKNPDGYKGTITIPSQVIFREKTYYVTEIGKAAFQSSRIETIIIQEGITIIDDAAFWMCSNLSKISLPTTLKIIGESAFRSTAITDIELPESVSIIGLGAFMNCSNLMTIKVDERNQTFDSRGNCNAIIKGSVLIAGCNGTTIPQGITEIGESAFQGTSLKCINLPKTLIVIGKAAFESSKIESVDIPEGVNYIGDNAFWLCSNLYYVTLPTTLTIIGKSAFRSTAITEIELPKSVSTIGADVFTNCSNLVGIIVNHEAPIQIEDNLFSGLYEKVTLYVPIGTVSIYRQAEGWKNFVNIKEIEPDPTLVIDDMTYVIHKRAGLADLQSVMSGDYIVVPETIEYDGKSYPVTRILDSAFMGGNMLFLSIPKSITNVGVDVIKDCHRLAAIDWNPTFKPSDEFVGNIVNPNLLFYTTSKQYVPNSIRNYIIGEQASSITLSDEAFGNFYCPKAFTANSITYTHSYSLPTEKDKCQGWESIVVPFNVQTIKTTSGDVIKPVSVAEAGEKRFWLKELKETGLEEASQIEANVPYIISMPNWDGYQDFYNIRGDVTFFAQGATIGVTENNIVTSGAGNFMTAYQSIEKQNDLFALNLTETVYNGNTYSPGSAFIQGLRHIHPFEVYFTKSNAAYARKAISIADLMEGTTAITDIPVRGGRIYSDNGVVYIESATDGSCNIYSMSGLLLKKIALKKGTNTVSGLSKGVYIIYGTKVLVK